ncbi:DUF3298 domain-containing protein [Mucilaginibacter limnophilus]|uniref:DUF3298 domain-containing protein n=1 Tax=Mucilaginibacter limnophilus TaxID=1932778 RepID=A0A3S2UNV6_9SPHI|nr:DUF3298 and DUF4163 domain-containing protein [Mucilaginibacter limnophilus]RVU03069.1 DUF3298 domain-containing protein [Mucilaginibacter limnophilus]
MKYTFLVLLIAFALFSSCEWGVPAKKDSGIFTDTLIYQYKTIEERDTNCGKGKDSACTHAVIQYPEFGEQQKLNDSIEKKLLIMFAMDDKADSSLQAYARNILVKFRDFKKDFPEAKMYFELESHAKVLHQDSGIVAIEVSGYTFQGGAHGASYTGFINWDTKANKEFKLSDILIDNYKDSLTRVAEKIFRKQEMLSDTASLARDYFFTNDKFALNDNFMITPIGLKFLYNQYEIKPYAAGQTELLIPYAQIKPLIRRNTAVAQYVK